jgi:hypothetical protein
MLCTVIVLQANKCGNTSETLLELVILMTNVVRLTSQEFVVYGVCLSLADK